MAKSSESSRKSALEHSDFQRYVESLIQGCELLKLKGDKGKLHRVFRLDAEWQSIEYDTSILPCYNPSRTVEIAQIKEIRKGYNTDAFNAREKSPKFRERYPEAVCFSLVLRGGKVLDLIAPSKEVQEAWTIVLQQLLDRIKQFNREDKLKKWLEIKFKHSDKALDGWLDIEEAVRLLNVMNIQVSPDKALWLFNEAMPKRQSKGSMYLDKEGFYRLYRLLSYRPEITSIFEKHCANREEYSEIWTVADLFNFLKNIQKQDGITVAECTTLIETFEPLEENKTKHLLSLTGLTYLLLNQKLFAFDPACGVVYQDMTHPLTDYFIASSHNSYLMDHQLTGDSSIEAYIACLMSGCRCIELDCWDGDDGEPVITHGLTLTSEIHFEDVLQVVKDYGFKASPFPVILSLENHCSIQQQEKMAGYIHDYLKDNLFVGPVKTTDKSCPSPYHLKNKVLVKAKKLPDEVQHDAEVEDASDTEEVTEIGAGDYTDSQMTMGKRKETVTLAKSLSDCVYLKATKFNKFGGNEDGKFFEMSSVSEKKIMSLLELNHTDIIAHCQHQLVRVYPAATRFSSSNFNAIPIFDSGCQMIAINYQNHNKATQAYKAKFRDNGRCGYLLKPEFMRTVGLDVGLFEASRRPWLFRIRVISGQHLPKPSATPKDIIDPYVTVAVIGRQYDKKKFRTRMIKNNGFNPFWDTQMDFTIHNPDMAILRLKVKDQDNTSYNTLIGHYNIAVTCLQQGYRHIPLYDKNDSLLELATVFLHIAKEIVP